MEPHEKAAAKARLKEAFRNEIVAEIHTVERAVNARGPALSRAEVLRGIKCSVPECVAGAIRREWEAGTPIDSDLAQLAVDAFNEALDELAKRAVH